MIRKKGSTLSRWEKWKLSIIQLVSVVPSLRSVLVVQQIGDGQLQDQRAQAGAMNHRDRVRETCLSRV